MRRFGLVGLFAVLFIYFSGCKAEREPEEYLARVNNQYLTAGMLEERMGETTMVNEALIREYIHQWIITEILFQEAQRRGLDRDSQVLRTLQDIQRNLAVNALLEEEVYSHPAEDIRPELIEEYYEIHQQEFNAIERLMEISYVLFERRNVATTFRNSVIQGTDWDDALERIFTNPETDDAILLVNERRYYRERELYPPELWRAAGQLGIDGVSFPVNVDEGFYIIRLHSVIRAGDLLPLEYVRNEIEERLVIEKRKMRYDQLLSELRRRYPVEVMFEIPMDEDVYLNEIPTK